MCHGGRNGRSPAQARFFSRSGSRGRRFWSAKNEMASLEEEEKSLEEELRIIREEKAALKAQK
jgi:hypothetical protein